MRFSSCFDRVLGPDAIGREHRRKLRAHVEILGTGQLGRQVETAFGEEGRAALEVQPAT